MLLIVKPFISTLWWSNDFGGKSGGGINFGKKFCTNTSRLLVGVDRRPKGQASSRQVKVFLFDITEWLSWVLCDTIIRLQHFVSGTLSCQIGFLLMLGVRMAFICHLSLSHTVKYAIHIRQLLFWCLRGLDERRRMWKMFPEPHKNFSPSRSTTEKID